MRKGWMLRQKQSLPLECKMHMSISRIREWHRIHRGMVYVSVSGGKDSLVLLHLVRSVFPKVPAVFLDTGVEYPQVKECAMAVPNLVVVKPTMSFFQVLAAYGWPVISKETSQKIYEIRNTKSQKLWELRIGLTPGRKRSALPRKWWFLLDAPFKISSRCCDKLKKQPAGRYEKKSGRVPFLGTMASESSLRNQAWLKHGCNAMGTRKHSAPLSFWREEDIYAYLDQFDIDYPREIYRHINRTGCMYCLFGVHMQKPNKIQALKKIDPKAWNYCIDRLGVGKIMDFLKLEYK